MKSKKIVLGGDIQKSLAEGYSFDFAILFKDAFKVTRKHLFPLLLACLFIVFSLISLFTLFVGEAASLDDIKVIGFFFIFVLLISPPLTTGLMMMGVHHSIGLKTKFFDLFNYFNLILKLSLAAMVINLMTNGTSLILGKIFGDLGFVLSIIVLLYLKMSFCLVYPLIAEKKVSTLPALKLSFKLVHKNIGQFTLLLVIFCLLFFVGVLTSGIALLFIIPFCINTMGIVYRQICGVTVSVVETSETTLNKNSDLSDKNSDDDSGPRSGGFEA